jgi:photosystem II stability/assembly factor-like uncharacterized protein
VARRQRIRSYSGSVRLALLLGAMLTGVNGPAAANGRYPLATQLVRAPSDGAYLALRSTFGLLQSFDSGTTWHWICEQAAGYTDIQDPTLAISADGTLLVGAERLRTSSDRGCTWNAPIFPATSVTDLAVDPARPERIVVLSATLADANVENHLVESTDNGQTWTALGTPITDGFIGGTLELAPPRRIYVSGRFGSGQAASLERSDDGGMTWLLQPIDLAKTAFPFIAAVDPIHPDTLYVRSSGSDSDGVFVTNDAGATWTEVFAKRGGILGFALAPSSQSLAVGGPTAGIYVASVNDYQFEETSHVGVFCLNWSGAGLYACAKEAGDGFTLGLSTDRGASFTKLLELPSLTPLACPPESPTTSTCAPLWPPVAIQIGADAGADASKVGVRDPSLEPVTENAPSSCHCTFARSSPARSALPPFALFGFWALRRRVKRPRVRVLASPAAQPDRERVVR